MQEQPLVVISGASAGVGRAVAHRFAAGGYRIGLLARDPAGLAATQAELQAYGVQVEAVSVDVADALAVQQAAQQLEATLGPLAVWVNAAMVTVLSPIEQLSAAEIERVTQVTYLGTVHGTLAALSLMRPRNKGLIIQVGSALAYRAIPLQAAYCGRSSLYAVLLIHCAVSCCMSAAIFACAWCNCRRSIPRSSTGRATNCPSVHNRCHRFTTPT